MNTDKEQFQQQILFEEQIESPANDVVPDVSNEQPIYFDEQNWQATEEPLSELEKDIEEKQSSNWWLRIGSSVFALIIAIEAFDFFSTGFIDSPIVTGLYAILFTALVVTVGTSFLKEIMGLSQLKKQLKVQKQVLEINQGYDQGKAVALCQKIEAKLPCDITNTQSGDWLAKDHQHLNDSEIIQLFNQKVMSSVDQKAMNEIAKHSSETMMMVAISPIAFVDMLIVFWRNVAMIDKVAGLYGIKLGYWSRIKLIKEVLKTMVFAGASEIITDVGAEMIGADILGKLSGRAAQGLASGMLTARLGVRTVHLCRPLPFTQDNESITSVRKILIGQIKKLVFKE